MTGIAAVITREIQEWRRVFIAALAAGSLGVFAWMVSKTFRDSDVGVPGTLAVFAMMGFGVAILAGGGLIGRDLVERRMSFYFYKPLSDASIWGGKILAAVFLAVFSGILMLVPGIIIGRGLLDLVRFSEGQAGAAILIGATIGLVIISNSFYLSLRARSKWVLLDLAALGISIGLLSAAIMPLEQARALSLVARLGMAFAAVFLLALLVGGYAGLRRGRIDLREVHKFHALTAWPIVAVGLIVIMTYSIWVRSADAEDFIEPRIVAIASARPWMAVSGKTEGRHDYVTNLLLNVGSGQTFRIPGGSISRESLVLSEDGRRAVWFEPLPLDPTRGELAIGHPARLGRGRLMIATLSRKPRTEETSIVAAANQATLALSQDGSRLALLHDNMLTVTDLDSGRTVASVRIQQPQRELPMYRFQPRMFFVDPNVVRVYLAEGLLKIYEFDVAKRKLHQTGLIEKTGYFNFRISPSGALLLRQADLHDSRTGQFLGTLVKGEAAQGWRQFLSDDRIVFAWSSKGRAMLELFSPSGERQKTLDLGAGLGLVLGGEAELGKLVIAISPHDPREWQKYRQSLTPFLVDLASGEIQTIPTRAIPLGHLGRRSKPGNIGTRLFESPEGQLIYLDPKTGEQRLIAGQGRRKGATS